MKKQNYLNIPALNVEKDMFQAHKTEKWLYKFYDVSLFPEGEPYDSIKLGYKQKDIKSRVWAMLVNGCIASGKRGFALSQSGMIHYFNSDPNIQISSIKGSVYSNVRQFLSKCSTFEVFSHGSDKKEKIDGKYQPRLYKIKDEMILAEIAKNVERLTK